MEHWLQEVVQHLASQGECSPFRMARIIHEALEIAQIAIYATPESRFTFTFSGASEEDLAQIMECLTPLERSVVVLKCKEG